MPPKPKFTREEIVDAAMKIAAERGMKALTSRELGAALGSSARPIFTVFKNMDEVKTEVRRAALRCFEDYAKKAEGYTPAFKQVGLQMILFAKEQPELYRLLFMSENFGAEGFDDIYGNLGATADDCIGYIRRDYGLNAEEAMTLFRDTWIFTYGVGSLIASGVCRFSENDIQDMLSREFVALLELIRSDRGDKCTTVPKKT